MHNRISDRLKRVIKELDMTYKEFAEKCGIPYRTLQNYLLGKREPNASNLEKICIRMGINVNWLLTGEGEMFLKEEEPMIISGGIGNIQTKGEGNIIGGIQISIGEKGEKNELEITTDMEINDKVKKIIKLLLEGHYTPLIIDEILNKLEKIKEINKGVG